MATSILALQNAWADGETLPDTWLEDVANNVEYARFGYIAIDVAGTGNITPSITTEANRKVLVLTGLLTGARTVLLPANAGQEWLIVNDTTGAFSLTVKVSGQTGFVITQGYRARAWCDGTDIRRGGLDYSNAGLVQIAGGSITGITDLAVVDGGTGASSASAARTNLSAAGSATTITGAGGLTGGGDLSANRTLDLAAATEDAIGAAPAVSAGAEAGNAIIVTIQAKDSAGASLAARREYRVIITDAQYGAECAAAPDGGVAFGTGTVRQTITAGKQFVVMSDASGVIVLTLTESTAKTFYVEAMDSGRVGSVAAAFV